MERPAPHLEAAVTRRLRQLLAPGTKQMRKCRVCGCTNSDCRRCVEKTGRPCWWVEDDLCSACEEEVR